MAQSSKKLNEINKFLVIKTKIEIWNSLISAKDIKIIILNFIRKKCPGSLINFIKTSVGNEGNTPQFTLWGCHNLDTKTWKKHCKKKKKAGVAILISDKVYFKTKSITRDTKRCFIIIKGSNHQNNILKVNIFVSYKCSTIHKAKINRIKKEIDNFTILVKRI